MTGGSGGGGGESWFCRRHFYLSIQYTENVVTDFPIFIVQFLKINNICTKIHNTFLFLIQITWNLHTAFTKILQTNVQNN